MGKKKRRGPLRRRRRDGIGGGDAGRPGGGTAGGEGGPTIPPSYETKFAAFIRMTEDAKGKVEVVIVDHPAVLGDDYAELTESLSRLAEAEVALRIARRLPGLRTGTASASEPKSKAQRSALPLPNVTSPRHGDDLAGFGEAEIRGIAINPVYAGVGEYPRMIPDDQWIAAAGRTLEEDGPDQFLVNLLYVLRRTFGCIEWGSGQLPPDRN